MPTARIPLLLLTVFALLGAGCGGDDDGGGGGGGEQAGPRGPASAELRRELAASTAAKPSDFPPPRGRTLQQLGDAIGTTGPEVGLATQVLVPGTNRVAFGVIDARTGFVYGPTAVYVARTPDSPARGPYVAPADLLLTDEAYRSRTAATEDDPFAAVYGARVPLPDPGRYAVLVVTRVNGDLVVAPTQVNVLPKGRDPVRAVGEPAPRVDTDTVEDAAGDLAAIDTRIPPSDMHEESFRDVVGRKPAVLLFATPQLCSSRVCGPVVDIAAQLKERYGDRVEFIHQEVYVDNDPKKGLRPSLKAFGLPTEPWLFTVGRDGRIKARLEGSFGFNAFERAIRAAL